MTDLAAQEYDPSWDALSAEERIKRICETVQRRRPIGWRMANWLLELIANKPAEPADESAEELDDIVARTRVGGQLLPPDTLDDGVDLPTFDARTQGYTGDCCQNCGGFRVVRSGTCGTCMDCGTTSGCS